MSPVSLPLGNDSHFMRMLREAQGVSSARTSSRVSPFMSHGTNSPKSPPNSPNNGREDNPEATDFSHVYINHIKDGEISDFIWDWSSRPNILPPKQWTKIPSSSSKSSTKSFTVFKTSKSKNKFVYTVVITNIISLILGAGIGIWLFRNPNTDKILPA